MSSEIDRSGEPPPAQRDADCSCPLVFHDDHLPGAVHYFSCPQRVRQGGHLPPADALRVSSDNWQRIDTALREAGLSVYDPIRRLLAGAGDDDRRPRPATPASDPGQPEPDR